MQVDDRFAILDLIADYTHFWDGQDAERWARLFTPDGVQEIYLPGIAPPVSRLTNLGERVSAARRAFTIQSSDARRTRSIHSDIRFDELEENRASVRSTFTVMEVTDIPLMGTIRPMYSSTTIDEFLRTPNGWRFQARQIHSDQHPHNNDIQSAYSANATPEGQPEWRSPDGEGGDLPGRLRRSPLTLIERRSPPPPVAAESVVPQPLDRTALLAALRSDSDWVADALGALPAEALERGAYERGWTVKDIAAHLASIEWTYPRLIQMAQETDPIAGSSSAPLSREPSLSHQQMDDYNAREVAKRRETPLRQLIEEFRSNRAVLIEAVEGASAELFEREIHPFDGTRGSLLQVIWSLAVEHVRSHLDDLQRA